MFALLSMHLLCILQNQMFNLCTVRMYSAQVNYSDVGNDHSDLSNGQGETIFMVSSLLIQAPHVFELF